MNQDLTALKHAFAINGQVNFRDTGKGFIVAEITNKHCAASIALQGAHLLSWTPAAEQPVIWMSEAAQFASGKSIRGGIPICWPWFGAHVSDPSFPAHGFARTALWQVVATEQLDDGRIAIAFYLDTNPDNPLWPHAARCVLTFRLGSSLEMDITTINKSNTPITIGQALHTYFTVADIRNTSVRGLENRAYLDKPDGFRKKQQHGPITFSSEVDRVYLDTGDDCLIEDPAMNRNIRIKKSGSASTIVWNPYSERAAEMGDLGEDGYLSMLCVESANAADDIVTLAAGASHTLSVRYDVEPLTKK